LFASAFLDAGKAVAGKTELTTQDMVVLLSAAIEGVQRRGKAKPGDKTMLDALVPARDSAQKAADKGLPIGELFDQAAAAASGGVEATRAMKSVQGRARWLQERSIGQIDPGAEAVAVLLRACSEFCEGA
jgi:dihydroxyacetone kinase-like protein